MKEFKQTPKMHAEGKHYCGGKSVKKMATGGSIDRDWANAKPVEMPHGDGKPPTMKIDGRDVELKPVQMPSGRSNDGIEIPGFGKVKPVQMPSGNRNLQLLKTGGKVKRGAK